MLKILDLNTFKRSEKGTDSLRWIFFAAILLTAAFYLLTILEVENYRKRLDNAKLRLRLLSDIVSARQKLEGFQGLTNEIRKSEPSAGKMLQGLSNITPKEIFLERFSLDSDSGIIRLSGFVKSNGQDGEGILPNFVSTLEKSGRFKDLDISSLEKGLLPGSEIYKFSLTAKAE